jgi:hypothetical protein
MPKLPEDQGTPEQYEETVHPDNPPNSIAGPASVVAGMWYYLGPLAVGVLILLIALWFAFGGDPASSQEPGATPTSGQQAPADPAENPAPTKSPDTTNEELKYRGGGDDGL